MFLSNIWCRKRPVFALVKKIQVKKAIIDIIGLPSLKNVAGVSSGASCFLYLLLCLIIFEMYSQSFMSIWRSQIVCYYLATLYTSHYVFAGYCHNGLRYFFNSIKLLSVVDNFNCFRYQELWQLLQQRTKRVPQSHHSSLRKRTPECESDSEGYIKFALFF